MFHNHSSPNYLFFFLLSAPQYMRQSIFTNIVHLHCKKANQQIPFRGTADCFDQPNHADYHLIRLPIRILPFCCHKSTIIMTRVTTWSSPGQREKAREPRTKVRDCNVARTGWNTLVVPLLSIQNGPGQRHPFRHANPA